MMLCIIQYLCQNVVPQLRPVQAPGVLFVMWIVRVVDLGLVG